MKIRVFDSKTEMGIAAAQNASSIIRQKIDNQGLARIVLATGVSQFELLEALVKEPIDWSKTTVFHLDEYISLPATHPASFRRYLRDRFVDRVAGLADFHAIDGEAADAAAECRRLAALLQAAPIDLACIGIGENGHLAFNDPPADFDCKEPFIIVDLDDACRRQQVGEGWFATLDSVPSRAISMSIPWIMRCQTLVCTVPDERKAPALQATVEGPITPMVPASILQKHGDCRLFIDRPASSLLKRCP
jgi:glucosamine-6-phosphate deaminase